MLTSNDTILHAQDSVRSAVRGSRRTYSPADLLEKLRDGSADEDQLRIALWYLLDQQEIELTADWKLDIPDHQDVKP